jgi:phage major head subunit gpT-like protein
MAQVIMTEASGRLKELYGEIQAPLMSLVTEKAEAYEAELVTNKLFAERKSEHSIEAYTNLTAIDSWAPVGESGAHPSGGQEVGYTQTLRNVTWKGSFALSRELVDDLQTGTMITRTDGFMRDYTRKRVLFFTRLIAEAMQGHNSFSQNGIPFSTLSADQKNVFNNAHPCKVKGGAQSNVYSDAFSVDALFRAMTVQQNYWDDDGNILALTPNTIIIPNIASVKKLVFEAIGSYLDPNSSNNTYNVVGGDFDVIVLPELNKYVTAGGTIPWLLFDSQYNASVDGLIRQERTELEIRDKVADNDDYVVYGYARYTGGFVDWRPIMACGVAGAGALPTT